MGFKGNALAGFKDGVLNFSRLFKNAIFNGIFRKNYELKGFTL